jgi:hypothetical protein
VLEAVVADARHRVDEEGQHRQHCRGYEQVGGPWGPSSARRPHLCLADCHAPHVKDEPVDNCGERVDYAVLAGSPLSWPRTWFSRLLPQGAALSVTHVRGAGGAGWVFFAGLGGISLVRGNWVLPLVVGVMPI